jgi:hypothetical protein
MGRDLRQWLAAACFAIIAGTVVDGWWGPLAGRVTGGVVAWLVLGLGKRGIPGNCASTFLKNMRAASQPPPGSDDEPPEPVGAPVPRPRSPVLTGAAARSLPKPYPEE